MSVAALPVVVIVVAIDVVLGDFEEAVAERYSAAQIVVSVLH